MTTEELDTLKKIAEGKPWEVRTLLLKFLEEKKPKPGYFERPVEYPEYSEPLL